MDTTKITALKYGESVWTEDKLIYGGNPQKVRHLDFIIYLLEDEDRKILVDAGCDTIRGFKMQNFIGPVAALEKAGVKPEEITDVIITHAHHDHIEGVKHFTRAQIYIQRDEYESKKPCYILDKDRLNIFEDECVIFKSIRAVRIGGHTKGSSIVLFEMNGMSCVITGDECYKREALEKKLSWDNPNSKAFFEEFSKPKYTVYFCHDK